MEEVYKKYYLFGMLALLLISCSLTNTNNTIRMNKTTQSSSINSKSRDIKNISNDPAIKHCSIETGYSQGRVNLRGGAGLTFDVLIVLKEGDRLEVLDNGSWLAVRTEDGLVGYIKSNFCTKGEKTNEESN
ncbi:MAG: SH3 domain-containing protein [Anaerolineae bacterium]|jgi:uncharacterized protein YgiM (DUF1202 family)|nr:SH3 domain-containing protein [Anaerolineae bacterium]MBT3713506.1 SH3 domain-containing protein [Anaerolineae bacterium]MBT4310275.1 SH3 domain-containing protein [Anaerolineae bacterium]MBT4460097.1 SH3 domain-containing protein [Anaerolineae bacterium]MBT4842962.1 SH3 domain-containing protein [Anaerolineae bacterium]